MRRLVVPLIVTLILGLMTGSVCAQHLTQEQIGFLKPIYGAPGDTVAIPLFLQNDSTVSGVSLLFEFDHTVLHPIIAFNSQYQELLDSAEIDPSYTPPESTVYQATAAYDPGLWELYLNISDAIKDYGWVNPIGYTGISHPSWAIKSVYYNLNARDSVRVLMAPNFVDSTYVQNTPAYIRPHIPGGMVYATDTLGVVMGTIQFVVDTLAEHGDQSFLHVTRNIPLTYKQTELAEEWADPAGSLPQTVAVYPQNLLSSVFVVDTAGGEEPPPDENQLPVLATITPTIYNIMQSELVSFTVTASDAEGGVVTLRVNGGSLTTPNASFGTSGVVTGAGGVASGTFSFKPDLGQEGNFVFTFQATDDSGATSGAQSVTVIVEGFDEDVLFTTSSEEFMPSGGVPGLDEVIVPINVVTEKVLYGIQFDMTFDADYFELDSIFTSDRTQGWQIYDNADIEPGNLRVLAFGLSNDSMVAGSTSATMYMAFTVDEFAMPGCYDLNIFDGWESIDPDPSVPSLELVTQSGILCVDMWGDVNLDRRVNVADLVSVVAYIIGNYDLTKRQYAAGDMIVNDSVNVVDLVGIINTIIGLPLPENSAPAPLDDNFATLKVWHNEIPDAGIQAEAAVEASLPTNIAGVELEVRYNPGAVQMMPPYLTAASDEMVIYYSDNGTGTMRVLLHSEHPWNEGELIPEGLADIIRLPFISRVPIAADDDRQVRIVRAAMSTGAAKGVRVEGINTDPILPDHFELYQNRPNPFNPTTNIDFYIDGSSVGADDVKLEVFNILGQTVKTLIDEPLPPGQYSIIWDGTDIDGKKVASGIYLYRLKVGDADKTKKMVLLK